VRALQVGRGCFAVPGPPKPCLLRIALATRVSRSTALIARNLSLLHEILAPAPDALMLADAPPAALLEPAPDALSALILADGRPAALLARAPDALVLADAPPLALLAPAPPALMLAEGSRRCPPRRTPCTGSSVPGVRGCGDHTIRLATGNGWQEFDGWPA
jgi:hypothetical protein